MNQVSLNRNYTLPVFNAARIDAFARSMNCPEKYRGLAAEELWEAMQDESLYMAYSFYVHMTWLMERGKRNMEKRGLTGVPLIQAKVRHAEAIGVAADSEVQANVLSPAKSYSRLFADTVDKSEWSPVELEVRKMFLDELEKAKASGGCTGCKRGRLVAKYVEKVRRLTADAQQ